MIFNLIVIITILISGHLYSKGTSLYVDSNYNRKKYIKFISIILIIQSGFRNVAVGADTYAYYSSFEGIKRTSWIQIWSILTDYYSQDIGKDPGYYVLQKIIQIMFPNFQIFLLLIAILFFSALGGFIYKNTSKLSHAIFAFVLYSCLFYNFFSITGLRQTIATAATLYSFELIKKKKLFPFLILILLASTIHKSSLVFLPFYFIANIKSTKFVYGVTLLSFPVVFTYMEPINNFLKKAGGYDQYDKFAGAGAYTFTIMLLLVAIVSWWRIKPVLYFHKEAKLFYNAFALAIFLTPLTFINQSSMRIVQYFSIFLLVLLPAVIQSFQLLSSQTKKIIFSFAIVLLVTLTIRSNWNEEYKFFWQTMELGENYK